MFNIGIDEDEARELLQQAIDERVENWQKRNTL